MRPVVCFVISSIALSAAGQISFERTYGGAEGDVGFSVQQTSDGGYALFGGTSSSGNGSLDMYLVKTDAYGTEEWSRTYGTVDPDMGYCARQITDGGYILCGMVNGFGNDTLTLIRTDLNGIASWTRTYPGTLGRDIAFSVLQTSDGGFAVCGFTENTGVEEDVYVIRTDANGDPLWTRTVDLGGSEAGWTIRQTADDGFIVLANSFNFADPDGEIHLIRFDVNGDTLWTRTIVSPGVDESRGLAITSDGGFIIAGGNGYPSRDILLVRTDENGMEQWRRTHATTGDEMAMDVQEMEDGGFICAGRKENSQNTNIEMHLFRTDASGFMQWERTFPRNIFSEANSLDRTSDGGFVVFGTTADTVGGSSFIDMFLVKTDGSGYVSVWTPDQAFDRLNVFPNPASDRIQLDAGEGRMTSVTVFDATGRSVLSATFNSTARTTLDVGHLPDGPYVLVVGSNSGTSSRQALLIAH